MQIIGSVLIIAINLYTIVMWARLLLDWALVLAPSFRPKGPLLVIAEFVYTVTDPPLRLIRRVVKPVRVGQIALDLAWIVLLIGLSVLGFIVRIVFLAP